MLLIFQRLWQVNWAEQWQYRANLFMYIFYWLVSPIIYLAVWTSIANANGSVNGLTANDFITYYMILLICDQITSNILIHIFAFKVQDGTLSGELIKPIHPMLTNALVNDIAFKALNMMILTPIWIVLALLFKPDFASVSINGILLSIPVLLLGYSINFLLSARDHISGILDDARIFHSGVLLCIDPVVCRTIRPAQTHAHIDPEHRKVFAIPIVHVPAHSNDPGKSFLN